MFSFLRNRNQYAKGAILFLAGITTYFGFNIISGGREESSRDNLATEIKDDSALFDNSFEAISTTIDIEQSIKSSNGIVST